jgi:peptidoglycan hydrolase-like protein with peptidoglycan-binding domain
LSAPKAQADVSPLTRLRSLTSQQLLACTPATTLPARDCCCEFAGLPIKVSAAEIRADGRRERGALAEDRWERVMVAEIGKSTEPSTASRRQDVSGSEPASFRYYNPGAQYPSERAARFGQTGYGIIGGGHKIARFPSPVNGAAANFDLLSRNYVGMSMGAAGKKWTGSYGFGIPGYPDDRVLTKEMLDDAKLAIAILKAIAGRESGRGNNLSEEQWQQAHLMFKAGSADDFLNGRTSRPPTPSGEASGPTGAGLLRRAREHIGEKYVNRLVPKDDPDWKGPWDCAEFMSWLVYQEAKALYGCLDDDAKPSKAEAYTGAWKTDVEKKGIRVSVDEAAATVGGILLRYPPAPGAMGHIAVCDGEGGTVEAKGKKFGVVEDSVHGRRWDTGVLIPGISYSRDDGIEVRAPASIYRRNAPNMDEAVIVRIQQALAAKGFSPGGIDGEFGPATEAAVLDFQRSKGLVEDGEVGADTAAELGIALAGPLSPGERTDGERPRETTDGERSGERTYREIPVPGDRMMNPLIGIAISFFPEIAKFLIGDKVGAIAGAVKKVVTEVARTENPEEARQRLQADPKAAAELQLKLAEIAADQEAKRQQAQLDLLKLQYEDEAKRRDVELQTLGKKLEDTKDARANVRALAVESPLIAATAPALSYLVTVGFFIVLLILLGLFGKWAELKPSDANAQIINIVIGALVAAFATVVNFWLGSSQGSRTKEERQAQQTTEMLENNAKQNAEVLEKSSKQVESAIRTMVGRKPAAEATKNASHFNQCVDIVMTQQGIKRRAADPGGTFEFGLTLEELRSSRSNNNLTADDLNKLTREQAREIYRTRYWNVSNCDELPVGVDLVVFDFGVDAGLTASVMALQEVVGAGADGSVGPVTIAATKLMSPAEIVRKVSERRSQASKDRAQEVARLAQNMIGAGSAMAA